MGNNPETVQVLPQQKSHLPEVLFAQITCPNCFLTFRQGSPLSIQFDEHVRMCLISVGMESDFLNQESSVSSIKNYFYEKVVDIDRKITWKKTSLKQESLFVSKTTIASMQECPFQAKLKWFRSSIEEHRISWEEGYDKLDVDKDNIIWSVLDQIHEVDWRKEVKIIFEGERAIDAGGLFREWMHMIIGALFDGELGLMTKAKTEQLMYSFNTRGCLSRELSKKLIELLGTLIGKALFDKISIGAYFDRAILLHLCSREPTLEDIKFFDRQLYQSWTYILNNTVGDLDIFFIVEKELNNGQVIQIQLIEGGSTTLLTDSNKQEYIKQWQYYTLKYIKYYCSDVLQPFLKIFLPSVDQVVPLTYLSIFQPHELEMLLYGVPFINVNDWKHNTEYRGAYTATHRTIRWFWKTVKEFSQEELKRLLYFCTGSTRLPIQGFSKLETSRGKTSKFVIQSSFYIGINPFPKGHTCFNRLQLPVYPTKQLTSTYVRSIVSLSLEGVFGLQ